MKGEQVLHFLKHHSPTILTCLGAIGVVSTSVLAAKATPKALLLLEQAEYEKGGELTNSEIVKTAAPVYIPAAISGFATLSCIFGANVLNKRQQATLMSGYALVNNAYKEYKNKAKEMLGEDVEAQIRDEIVKDKVDTIKRTRNDDSVKLIYDMRTGEYFEGTIDFVELGGGLECYIIDF